MVTSQKQACWRITTRGIAILRPRAKPPQLLPLYLILHLEAPLWASLFREDPRRLLVSGPMSRHLIKSRWESRRELIHVRQRHTRRGRPWIYMETTRPTDGLSEGLYPILRRCHNTWPETTARGPLLSKTEGSPERIICCPCVYN